MRKLKSIEQQMKERGWGCGRPNFIGVIFRDKNGKETLVKPCPEVKEDIEDFLIDRDPSFYPQEDQ